MQASSAAVLPERVKGGRGVGGHQPLVKNLRSELNTLSISYEKFPICNKQDPIHRFIGSLPHQRNGSGYATG